MPRSARVDDLRPSAACRGGGRHLGEGYDRERRGDDGGRNERGGRTGRGLRLAAGVHDPAAERTEDEKDQQDAARVKPSPEAALE